jgi:hypothetical protein
MDLWLGISVVIATVCGPVLAVLVTRYIDRQRDQRARRMEVFRALMAFRKAPLSPERVKALNMVEIEFHGIQPVEDAHRALMQHVGTPAGSEAWVDRSHKLSTKLLSEMAGVLGYDLQQLDVLEGGYYPQGYVDLESEQQNVRRLLIEILSGRRPLPVSPAAPTPPSPLPPPPAPAIVASSKVTGR